MKLSEKQPTGEELTGQIAQLEAKVASLTDWLDFLGVKPLDGGGLQVTQEIYKKHYDELTYLEIKRLREENARLKEELKAREGNE